MLRSKKVVNNIIYINQNQSGGIMEERIYLY